MSRVTRLKYKKRKMRNRIKATSCCLTLALVMGISQGIGTYALFTDREDIPSDISLSTGDVDVDVSEGKDFQDVKPGDIKDISVKITNNGTLNQNISLDFYISKGIESYLTYEYVFDGITIDNGVMHNRNNSGLVILAPGDSIEGSIRVTVKEMSKEMQSKLSGEKYKLDLTVKSTQINKDNTLVNNGFYDIAVQESTISIAQRDIITIATGKEAYFTGGDGNSFKKLYVPVNIKSTNDNFKLSAEVSVTQVNNKTTTIDCDAKTYKYKDRYYILIESLDKKELPFKGIFNITITVNIMNGDKIIETYELKCNTILNNAGNDCNNLDHPDHKDGKCHGEIVSDGLYNVGKAVEALPSEGEFELEYSSIAVSGEDENQIIQNSNLSDEEQNIEEDGDKNQTLVETPNILDQLTEEVNLPKSVEPPKETEDLQE